MGKLEFIGQFAAAGAIASPWGEAGKNRLKKADF